MGVGPTTRAWPPTRKEQHRGGQGTVGCTDHLRVKRMMDDHLGVKWMMESHLGAECKMLIRI
ncbi:hypothetical protein YC2023_089167 [Brassica napus]